MFRHRKIHDNLRRTIIALPNLRVVVVNENWPPHAYGHRQLGKNEDACEASHASTRVQGGLVILYTVHSLGGCLMS